MMILDRQVIPNVNPSFVRKKRSVASHKDLFLQDIIDENRSPRLSKQLKKTLIPRIREIREQIQRANSEEQSGNPKILMKARLQAKQKVSYFVDS